VSLADDRFAKCRGDANPEDIVKLESSARKAKIGLATWQRRQDLSTHWLRHTFAKEVINGNDNEHKGPIAAQQLLGTPLFQLLPFRASRMPLTNCEPYGISTHSASDLKLYFPHRKSHWACSALPRAL
jgi:hypothetical protein